jgi:hypothetical protein
MALSARWPQPEEAYRKWFDEPSEFELGAVRFVQVERNMWVANMHGKTCFTFRTVDERLFLELEKVTADVISASREAGLIAE